MRALDDVFGLLDPRLFAALIGPTVGSQVMAGGNEAMSGELLPGADRAPELAPGAYAVPDVAPGALAVPLDTPGALAEPVAPPGALTGAGMTVLKALGAGGGANDAFAALGENPGNTEQFEQVASGLTSGENESPRMTTSVAPTNAIPKPRLNSEGPAVVLVVVAPTGTSGLVTLTDHRMSIVSAYCAALKPPVVPPPAAAVPSAVAVTAVAVAVATWSLLGSSPSGSIARRD